MTNSRSTGVKVVCFATERNDALEDWLLTSQRFGYDPIVLGLGERWKGFYQKTNAFLNYVKSLKESKELIVCCDAYDILFNAQSSELKQRFESYGKNIVIGMEEHCGTNCVGSLVSTSAYCYVNAGCVMGFVDSLVPFYETIQKMKLEDDQIAMGKLCQNPEQVEKYKIGFDTKRHLVCNIIQKPREQLVWRFDQQHQFVLKLDGVAPCLIHFPGTLGDFFQRENWLRGHLVGQHRRANTSQILKAFYQKHQKKVKWTLLLLGSLTVLSMILYHFCKEKKRLL